MTERDDLRREEWARIQEIMRLRLTRRSLLKGAGVGVAGLSLSAILAACGEDGGTVVGGNGATGISPEDIYDGQIEEGTVQFMNWPLYIDKAKRPNGDRYIPSIEKLKEDLGIDVNYQEDIQDNAEFFGRIQPQLAAGDPTGFDIIVITNGPQFSALTRNGWVWPLDPTRRPNFDQYAQGWAKGPAFDPENTYSMAWQSGITGIAINKDLINGTITKLDDLANPDIVGTDSVNMLRSDMPEWTMINLGIDPTTSGPDEWKVAADWLQFQKDQGVVRSYVTQGYTDDMTAGNVSATMAWSGDVLYYALWAGYSNLEFIGPPAIKGLLWIDNMLIPANSERPDATMAVMDYYYKPNIATKVTEWVLYMAPVKGVQERIAADAEAALEKRYLGYGNKLKATAESNYLFPDESFLSQTSFGREFTEDEEYQEYLSIFEPVWQTS